MRVLVTGAAGQVGSELIQRGEELGLQMLAVDHQELDLRQQSAVDRCIQKLQPDILINAAAYTAVDKAESEPELAYAVNRDGAANLARACADSHLPLFHLSTDYIFDGRKSGAYVESDSPNPQSIYGKSKLAGDRAIETYLKQYIILRVSWVFGAQGSNFVSTMLRLGNQKDLLKLVSDQHGGPTWAGDIATTLLELVKRWGDGKTIPWGSYHFSGQPETSWLDFAQAIFDQSLQLGMMPSPPKIEPIGSKDYPTKAQRPLNSVLDCRKIESQLGIIQPDWRVGLREVLVSWKEQ